MAAGSQLPPAVAALLAEAFPDRSLTGLAPAVGGFSNLTLLARLGDTPCAIKAATTSLKRQDLAREAAVLTLLANSRLGTPRPLALLANGEWSVLITRRRPGLPGLRLYERDPAALVAPLGALGRTLGRLHRLDLPLLAAAPAHGLLLAERASALAAALDALPLPPAITTALYTALAHPAWRPARPRLVHGDAGLHNVLWVSPRVALLDWELAGWGDPRLDLAWVAWTLRFRGLPPSCWQALLAGYSPARAAALDLEPAALHALALGQVAALLLRAAGRPAWDEWLRRANWTIAAPELP